MILLQKYKTVISNFGYLSVLNILDMVLPLIVIPFITQAIGASKFGIYAYVLVIVQNINLLTQYGFQFSATKRISQHRGDISFVSQLTCTVLATRLVLAMASITFVLALSDFLLDSEGSFVMFLSAIGMIIGDVFIPSWLFQGMERMKYITIVNALAKGIFTLLILALIRTPEDYVYILALNSIGFILAAITSIVLARRQFGIQFRPTTFANIKSEIRNGLSLFGSTVSINLYRNINVIILHFFVSDAAVGIYNIAEKIIKACQSVITPISQALFPYVGHKIKNEGIDSSWQLIKKSSFILFVLTMCASVCLWFFSDLFVQLTGRDFTGVEPVMALMFPVLIFGCQNFLLGFVGLINIGKQRLFFYIVFLSGTVSLIFLLSTVTLLGVNAAAIGMSLSEILLYALCVIILRRTMGEKKLSKK